MFQDEPNPGEMIGEMVIIQDQLNCELNSDWRVQKWPFMLAVRMEAAEMVDHIGWKWWKDHEINFDAVRGEIVDIWHFLLSDIMVHKTFDSPVAMANEIKMIHHRDANHAPQAIAQKLMFGPESQMFYWWLMAVYQFFSSFEQFFSWYIAKVTLNRFRWEHGYKEGKYDKFWYFNGKRREGNEVCHMLAQGLRAEKCEPKDFQVRLFARLGIHYAGS